MAKVESKKSWIGKKDFADLVDDASRMMNAGAFPGFIQSIRFPFYRNLAPDSALEFRFPLVVLTGANGSGKSSVLQALYGAPDGKSVGRYWFSTDVDPIEEESSGRRPSFVYRYMGPGGEVLEPIKTRIRKRFAPSMLKGLKREKVTDKDKLYDPNYWEPSRPLAWAGLKTRSDGSRDPAVQRDVVYLHFRTQLSAFDAAFHGEGLPTTAGREFLRTKSRYLFRDFEGEKPLRPRGSVQSKPAISISTEELEVISWVVGKTYKAAKVVEHKHFGRFWGESVRYELEGAQYSDAFAGSGEHSIFRLVRALEQAQEGALIVLDEPEISLHPEAQRRMQHVLLAYCTRKKFQIVVATHSSHFVNGLPLEAIYLFQPDGGGRFLARNVPSELAMVSIGHGVEKRRVLVEDALAQLLVERVLHDLDPKGVDLLDVAIAAGGVSAIFASLALDPGGRSLGLPDGDQRPNQQIRERLETLVNRRDVSREELETALRDFTNQNVPKLYVSGDSGSGHAVEQEALETRRKQAHTFLNRVKYLPGAGAPEELLRGSVSPVVEGIGGKKAIAQLTHATDRSAKLLIREASRITGIDDSAMKQALVSRWAADEGDGYAELKDLVQRIIAE